MNIANIYRKLKQILDDSNIALVNKGCNTVSNLYEIPSEINKLGEINLLPYVLRNEIINVTKEDLYGITKIKDYAFDNCMSLASIEIPEGVITIGIEPFRYCNSLKNVYLYPTTPPHLSRTDSMPSMLTTMIHVPIGSGDAYKAATNWSALASRIVEDIEAL